MYEPNELKKLAAILERDGDEHGVGAKLRTLAQQQSAANLVPGVMHCAKCKFRLHRTTLYMRSGTTGAGDSKTEPCPNGCGPLWPVTWEQEAREAMAVVNTMHDQLQAAQQQGKAGGVVESEIARIGELIRTQDNRITSHPLFVVEQQRTVWAVDTDYDHDGFDWLGADGPVDPRKRARLERLHQAGGDTGKYRRLGFKHYWEFVTACFTEQGCKDYLDANGHNLREPRIYVYSGFRNAEWQKVRAMLAMSKTQEATSNG